MHQYRAVFLTIIMFAVASAAKAAPEPDFNKPFDLVKKIRDLIHDIEVVSYGNGRRENILAFNFQGGSDDCTVTIETELLEGGSGPRYQAYNLDFGAVEIGEYSSPTEVEFVATGNAGIVRPNGRAEERVTWTLPHNPKVLALVRELASQCQAEAP